MDRTSNQYNFPMYYQHAYDGAGLTDFDAGVSQLDEGPVPTDLSLAEYTLCHNMKTQLNSLVNNIGGFITNQFNPFNNIETELQQYEDTTSVDDSDFFNHLLEFMAGHADQFIIQLGEGFAISPTYVHNLKATVIQTDYLSNSVLYKELLNVDDDAEELYLPVSLSNKFVTRMHTSLMASVIEKLAANFRGSEFVIGFNLCIIEHNCDTYQLTSKVSAANQMATYLVENCTHHASDATETIEYMETYLTENSWFDDDGNINYDTFVYDNLTTAQATRVKQVKRYAKHIVGSSITEIRTKAKLNKLLMHNVSFPARVI